MSMKSTRVDRWRAGLLGMAWMMSACGGGASTPQRVQGNRKKKKNPPYRSREVAHLCCAKSSKHRPPSCRSRTYLSSRMRGSTRASRGPQRRIQRRAHARDADRPGRGRASRRSNQSFLRGVPIWAARPFALPVPRTRKCASRGCAAAEGIFAPPPNVRTSQLA